MRSLLVVWVLVASATESLAESRADVIIGPTGGMTVGRQPYFPIFFVGATASLEAKLDSRVSAGVVSRIQYYKHIEEEDFGSWGFEGDLGGELRLSLWGHHSRDVNPFVAGRAFLAAVERIPDDHGPSELITGYLIGGAIGVDLQVDYPITHIELAFDMPSFTTHDNADDPNGELSIILAGTLPW